MVFVLLATGENDSIDSALFAHMSKGKACKISAHNINHSSRPVLGHGLLRRVFAPRHIIEPRIEYSRVKFVLALLSMRFPTGRRGPASREFHFGGMVLDTCLLDFRRSK
jgi:hypothetical protein